MTQPTPRSRRSGARPRFRQRTALAAVALLCAVAGCESGPEEPEEPGEPRQVRTSFTFQQYPMESGDGIFVILDEDPEARGQFAGTLTFNDDGGFVGIASVEATMGSDRALRIPAGYVADVLDSFEWNAIELRLEDPDGDGVLDSGTGRISFAQGTSSDEFTAAPDGFSVPARAGQYSFSPIEEALPWESLFISFGQPVSSDQIQRYRVLADGQEVPGKLTGSNDGELHTEAVFVPDAFYPLGAAIEVEIDGMENALGVPVTMEHEPMQVLADLGSVLSNAGFEQALTGWHLAGDVAMVAGVGDLAPVEGASMAALRTALPPDFHGDSRLLGYFDVPMDATALDLSLALLTAEESLPQSIAIRIYHDLAEGGYEGRDVYEFDHESAVLELCDCSDLGADPPLTRRTAPFLHQIDLSALRGKRVFLEIQLDGGPYYTSGLLAVPPLSPPPPPVPAILLVDDLKLR